MLAADDSDQLTPGFTLLCFTLLASSSFCHRVRRIIRAVHIRLCPEEMSVGRLTDRFDDFFALQSAGMDIDLLSRTLPHETVDRVRYMGWYRLALC